MVSQIEVAKAKAIIDFHLKAGNNQKALDATMEFVSMMVGDNDNKRMEDIPTEELRYCMGGYMVATQTLEKLMNRGVDVDELLSGYAFLLLFSTRELFHRSNTPQNALKYVFSATQSCKYPDELLSFDSANEYIDDFVAVAEKLQEKYPNDENVQITIYNFSLAMDNLLDRMEMMAKENDQLESETSSDESDYDQDKIVLNQKDLDNIMSEWVTESIQWGLDKCREK